MLNKTLSLLAPCLVVTAVGCGGDSTTPGTNPTNNNNTTNNTNNNNNNNTTNNNPMGLTCPTGGALTICDLKLDGGAGQPQLGDPVQLDSVVVTAPVYTILPATEDSSALMGFFAQDLATSDELDWKYSGIQVTFRDDVMGSQPSLGDVISIEGSFRDFGQDGGARQKQLSATFLGDATGNMPVSPKDISDASSIATGGSKAGAYEGVLLKISGVSATVVRDVPGAGGSSIFGAFMVEGGLVISGTLYEPPAVMMGEAFTSITGILRLGTAPFDGGISLFTPRGAEDVVRANPPQLTTSIKELQDDTDPMHPTLCTSTGSMTQGVCPLVDFSDVVVTAVDSYVTGTLRAMWIQDTTIADGRFSGVKVVYSMNDSNIPQVGQRIDITGQAVDFFEGRQVQFADWTITNTETASVAAIVVAPADVSRTGGAANAYEGVLVKIENVSVINVCVEAGNGRDFGNFLVTGDVFLGNALNYDYNGMNVSSAMCSGGTDCSCAGMSRPGDMRAMMDGFASITGIMNYAFNDLRLEPRSNEDLVAQ